MVRKKLSEIIVLKEIRNRKTAVEIAKKHGVTKGTVSKKIKKLLQQGYIVYDEEYTKYQQSLTLKHVKYYILTKDGEECLAEVSICLGGSERKKKPKFKGVHNFQFKAKIIKVGEFWFDNQLQLKNWVKEYTWIGGVYIEKNGNSSFVFKLSIEDEDPKRAKERAKNIVKNIIKKIEKKGYVFGELEEIGRPKYEITGDPVAEVVSKEKAIITPCGAIDNTPEEGTLHFYDDEDVIAYLEFPHRLRELERYARENIENIQSACGFDVININLNF